MDINNLKTNILNFTKNNSSSIQKIKKIFDKNFVIFSIIGIIISYLFFSVLSILFKTPFIIIFGIFLGYLMNKLYNGKKNNES